MADAPVSLSFTERFDAGACEGLYPHKDVEGVLKKAHEVGGEREHFIVKHLSYPIGQSIAILGGFGDGGLRFEACTKARRPAEQRVDVEEVGRAFERDTITYPV